jgi:hypothetical protein
MVRNNSPRYGHGTARTAPTIKIASTAVGSKPAHLFSAHMSPSTSCGHSRLDRQRHSPYAASPMTRKPAAISITARGRRRCSWSCGGTRQSTPLATSNPRAWVPCLPRPRRRVPGRSSAATRHTTFDPPARREHPRPRSRRTRATNQRRLPRRSCSRVGGSTPRLGSAAPCWRRYAGRLPKTPGRHGSPWSKTTGYERRQADRF